MKRWCKIPEQANDDNQRKGDQRSDRLLVCQGGYVF